MNRLLDDELVKFMHQTTMARPNLPLLPLNAGFVFPSLTREIDNLFTKHNQNKKLLLPELRNHDETLAIFSDYSGEHSNSKFYTYTFFATTHGALFWFERQMKSLRENTFKTNLIKKFPIKIFNGVASNGRL